MKEHHNHRIEFLERRCRDGNGEEEIRHARLKRGLGNPLSHRSGQQCYRSIPTLPI